MNNPVLWLELRIRIRERKLWIVTCLYLFCLFVISAISISSAARGGTDSNPATTGMSIFGFGVFSLAGLLVILGPLASAGAISQEREQRTLPALLNTPMSPSTIVAGKLLAAWAFVLWLALLSLPFLALSVVWGAVDVARMASGLGLAIAAGIGCLRDRDRAVRLFSPLADQLPGYWRVDVPVARGLADLRLSGPKLQPRGRQFRESSLDRLRLFLSPSPGTLDLPDDLHAG